MHLDEARTLQPDVFAAFTELMGTVWDQGELEPELLELSRLRMATLTGCRADAALRYRTTGWPGIDEERVARLPSWPTSASFSTRERRVLRYAEEFAVDPASVSEDCWEGLHAEFDEPQTVQLTMSLAVLVEFQRFSLAAHLDEGPVDWSPSVQAVPAPATTTP